MEAQGCFASGMESHQQTGVLSVALPMYTIDDSRHKRNLHVRLPCCLFIVHRVKTFGKNHWDYEYGKDDPFTSVTVKSTDV